MVWAASYLPFGGIDLVWADTGALEQNLRFPGQWFQAETGLHQNWMRDYDPTTGRYLQADPLGLVDGPSIYGYARQNPMRWVDPFGFYTIRDANRSLQRRGVKGLGVFGEYTDDQLIGEWFDIEGKNKDWHDQLLSCPCNKDDASPVFWQGSAYWPNGVPYHDGGKYDLRSLPTAGGHGTQCIYDANGNLLMTPPGAGSADYVAFTGLKHPLGALRHFDHDVVPYYFAHRTCRVDEYYKVRPVK